MAADFTAAAGERAVHAKTLVASTVLWIDLARDWNLVEVASDGTAKVYFTVDGSTPTVAGGGTYVLPAAASERQVPVPTSGATQVMLISSGTPVVSVSGA